MFDSHIQYLILTVIICGPLLIVSGMASLTPQFGWLFDLLSHFRVQFAWLNIGWGLVGVLTGQLWLGPLNAIAGIIILGSLLPFRRKASEDAEERTKLVLFNVRMRNRSYHRTLEFVLAEGPDLVGLVEVDQQWLDAMVPLHGVFPHVAAMPHPSSYGLALYSRYPIRSWHPSRVREADVAHMEADVELPGGLLRILFAHLPPPFSPRERKKRDEKLARLGEIAVAYQGPTLLMGDFNASPWTPCLRAVERSTGMANFRRGKGLFATWPSMFLPGRIPIDQILGSTDSLTFGRVKVGPDLGSDHLPIALSLSLLASNETQG